PRGDEVFLGSLRASVKRTRIYSPAHSSTSTSTVHRFLASRISRERSYPRTRREMVYPFYTTRRGVIREGRQSPLFGSSWNVQMAWVVSQTRSSRMTLPPLRRKWEVALGEVETGRC